MGLLTSSSYLAFTRSLKQLEYCVHTFAMNVASNRCCSKSHPTILLPVEDLRWKRVAQGGAVVRWDVLTHVASIILVHGDVMLLKVDVQYV